jgi:hypothetical protein
MPGPLILSQADIALLKELKAAGGPRIRCGCRALFRGDARPRHHCRAPYHRLHPCLRLRGPHHLRNPLGKHPEEVLAWFPDRVIFVGGGPPVWKAYAPFIRHWDITRLPYDGEADRWFDPVWLVAAEKG